VCVRVGKSEDHFALFLVIHQQWLMKSTFVENGRILGKFTKGAHVSFDLDGTFWTSADLQKS